MQEEDTVNFVGEWIDGPFSTFVWVTATGWGPVLNPFMPITGKQFCALSKDWWGLGYDVEGGIWLLNTKDCEFARHPPKNWEILTRGDHGKDQ